MNTVVTPSLYCPFAGKTNKYVKEAGFHANEWVVKFNLLQNEAAYKNFYGGKFFELTAYFFPDAPLEELKIVNDWLVWLLILDDQCDMLNWGGKPDLLNSYQTRFIEVLKGDELNSTDIPLAWALKDIRQRMLSKVSIEWFSTFVQTVEDYFSACLWESNNRLQNRVPGVEEYVEKRLDTGAAYTIFKLLEFTQKNFLPEAVQKHSVVKELTKTANNLIAWSNDIISLSKESKQGDFHNLVVAIKCQEKLTLNQAIQESARLHDAEVHRFLSLEPNLPKFDEETDAKLSDYILGLRYCIRGNIDWSAYTYRYQNNAKGCLQTPLYSTN